MLLQARAPNTAAFTELAVDVAAMNWRLVKVTVLFGCAAARHVADVDFTSATLRMR